MTHFGRVHVAAVAALMLPAAAVLGTSAPPDPSLVGPPIRWYALLSPDEQSAVTVSPATGRVDFVLDRPTMRLSWTLSYQKLTSAPTGAKIHGPQTPGGNAGALIDLAPGGVKSPVQGSAVLTDGQLRYLTTNRLYVNITTTRYKNGELRGQIKRIRPGAAP